MGEFDSTLEAMLTQACVSTKAFAALFLQERFFRPFASLTDEIFNAIDDPKIQKVCIAAPRGWGKTSIDNIALPARNICYGHKRFIVPISSTATKAEMETENLKRELTGNQFLSEVFGEMKTSTWSKEAFIAKNTYVLPRGAGQQVRGINFNGARPDLIIVDDLEDSESVRSEEQRLKLKEWFFGDVCNSVDRGRDDWKIVVVGTILHEDALLANLLKDPTWHTIRLSICDENLKSNWPDYMSDEKVKELYEEYRVQGQADVFAREYRNVAISLSDAVFKSSYFKYYEPSEILGNRKMYFCTIVDPAKTVKLHAADSAIVTVGVDLETHKLFVHDVTAGKFYPDELYNHIFEHVIQHGSRTLGVEVTSLNEFITQPIKNEMRRRAVFPRFIPLQARAHKEDRVAQLAPYYRQGFIYHNKLVTGKLEDQLMYFPRSELWDVMDAFAYIVELLEKEQEYFYPGDGAEFELGYKVPESEYEGLDDDPPLAYQRVL